MKCINIVRTFPTRNQRFPTRNVALLLLPLENAVTDIKWEKNWPLGLCKIALMLSPNRFPEVCNFHSRKTDADFFEHKTYESFLVLFYTQSSCQFERKNPFIIYSVSNFVEQILNKQPCNFGWILNCFMFLQNKIDLKDKIFHSKFYCYTKDDLVHDD